MESGAVCFTGDGFSPCARPRMYGRGCYLAKLAAAYIGGVETAVAEGLLPARPPVVAGSSGVVRVLEAGAGLDYSLSGALVSVGALCGRGVLGVDVDGVLSEYPCVPGDSVIGVVGEAGGLEAALYWVLLGIDAAAKSGGGRLLVVGGGLSGVSAALYNIYAGGGAVVYTRRGRGLYRRLGVEAVSEPGEIHGSFSAVYVSSLSTGMALDALGHLAAGGVAVYSPVAAHVFPGPASRGIRVEIAEPVYGRYGEALDLWRRLRRFVRVVRVKNPVDAAGLVPAPGLGAVVFVGD